MTDQERIKRLAETMCLWNAMEISSYEAYYRIRMLFDEEISREWRSFIEMRKVTRK